MVGAFFGGGGMDGRSDAGYVETARFPDIFDFFLINFKIS